MNDSEELSLTLKSLGATRPRPRRNHKPSTPRLLSPSYDSLPSLFDDDQLAAFFPSVSTSDTGLPDSPSSAPSVLKSNGSESIFRYPSVPEESQEVHDEGLIVPADDVEEAREEEKRREVEERGEGLEATGKENGGNEGTRREEEDDRGGDEGARREDEENGGGNEARMEEEKKGENDRTRIEEKGRKSDWERMEVERGGDEGTRKEEVEVEEGKSEARREKEGVARYFSKDDEVFNDLDDATREDAPISRAILTETPPDSPLNSPLVLYPDQQRRSSLPICSTPDSMPNSIYTTDNGAPTEILSSPQSAAYEDEDLPNIFVFPPKISRLGSIYSNLGFIHSGGDSSSSESESDTCGTLPKKVSHAGRHPHDSSHATEDEVENEASVILRRKKVQKGSDINTERDSNRTVGSSSFKSEADERSGQAKKVPPAKPPRLRASVRTKNNDEKRRSREDPVRYKRIISEGELISKRSSSMTNIFEGNYEATDQRCSHPSLSPAKVTELIQPPTEDHGDKKERRFRSSFKYKDAAKIVGAIISKKPPFAPLLHRKDGLRSKRHSPKKMPCKDVDASPPSSPLAEDQRQDNVTSQASQQPNKPPRKDLDAPESVSLDKAQSTCSAHGALLHFYCVKCRVVVCRDCTVVAHSHRENHKVLDTLDSLATLRSEAVDMLRHYTILETMHAALTDIYRKFRLQHRDVDITAIKKRLREGKYLAEVVKEAECMVKSWTNLQEIRECVRQWEARQDEWGDLVFLASRCALLTDMNIPSDTVFLRMGSWVMPTPWIQLSHLLQPYLRTSTASQISSSSPNTKHKQLTPSSRRKVLDMPSPLLVRRSGSPYGGGTSTGGTDQPFPYNARQMVLSNLVPYIILNPDIRYFVHVGGPRDVDLTLVVVPVDDHAHDYLKRRRNNATKSPEELRHTNCRTPMDAITLVEQQMTCGACKTRITASSMPLGPSSAPTIVKVSFSDVKIVCDGQGLPVVIGGVKRGDVIVDQSSSRRPTLTVVVRDIADFPALRLGQVTWGMDGLTCLVGIEDTKRTESSGFRAKIRATVKREEEAVYDVMFGMDL